MTDHIKIPPILPRILYVGNGTQTAFTFPFPIFNAQDLVVRINNSIRTNGFTIEGAGRSQGGTVHFSLAPENLSAITLERRLPLQRISDFLEGGEFSANALNNELDYLAGSIQQIASDIVPMLHIPHTEQGISTTLPAKDMRANKVLGFDGQGQMTMFDAEHTYGMPSYSAFGDGAVTRNLTDKIREAVSVRDFGAIGDGFADDTDAITRALAAHHAVYIPAGNYRITSTIIVNHDTMLYGEGPASRIIISDTNMDGLHLVGSYNTLHDFVIVGGKTALRLYGAESGCQQNTIRSIRMTEAQNGIVLDGYENPSHPCCWNDFSHIAIDRFAQSGVVIMVSGAGSAPIGNKFDNIRIHSESVSSTGYGFDIQAAQDNNAFLDCNIHLAPSGLACMRIAADCYKCLIANLYTKSSGPNTPGLWLELMSYDTSITNLTGDTVAELLHDESEGSYNAFNAGDSISNILRRTRIMDLTTFLQRYFITPFTTSGSQVMDVDMFSSIYMINATNGPAILRLPKATAQNNGMVVTVKRLDGSINRVEISEAGGGAGPDGRVYKMASAYDFMTVISDGSVWRIINSNAMPFRTASFTGVGTYKPDMLHDLYLISATTALVVVELPPANAPHAIGRMITVKKLDATTQQVRLTEEGAVGPDNAAFNLTARYQAVTVMSNGSLWHVLSKYP
jgi:hypothetical protein